MSNGPDDFVSMADYMGLNDEAGAQMLNRTMADNEPHGGMGGIQNAVNAQQSVAGAGAASTAEFNQLGSNVKSGLASYGDYMKGLSDPAARQALMEKTYGKGNASWLDSAVAGDSGGTSRLADASKRFDAFRNDINQQENRAIDRKAIWDKNESNFAAGQARDTARRQANFDGQQKRNAQDAADSENRRVDQWAGMDAARGGITGLGKYNPNGTVGTNDFWGPLTNNEVQNQRDWARTHMKREEQTTGRRWASGSTQGGWSK